MSERSVATNALTGAPITDGELTTIALLATKQAECENQIAYLERQLEEAKEDLRVLQTERLPEAMAAIGLSSFKLADGSSVTVTPFYSGKIPDDKKSLAFAWLRDHNLGSLIKRNVTATFGMGQDKLAERAVKQLEKLGIHAEDKQSVHPMTLKSLIREQVEAGNDLPTDLFGVFVGSKSVITPAKQ